MSDAPERKLYVEGEFSAKEPDPASEAGSESKLHIDSDWKAEAEAEKRRLAEAEEKRAEAGPKGERGLPEASFRTLMSILASQAIMGLGTMADPQSGGVVVDLEGAKLSIDLLQVLEEKTKGNLSDEESQELVQLLSELRSRFVQIAQLVAQHAKAGNVAPGGAGGAPGIPPVEGG